MMTIRGRLCLSAAAIGIAVLAATPFSRASAQQSSPPGVTVGQSDLGGAVTGPSGPEAGVWVIAETTDLPTRFAKIVVTDDQGRYLIPDLPKAQLQRLGPRLRPGRSPRSHGDAGKRTSTSGRWPHRARGRPRNIIRAMYWYALLNVPAKSEFPMEKIKSQGEWLNIIKTGACNSLPRPRHARECGRSRRSSATFQTSTEAWTRRLMSGGAQMFMIRDITRLDTPRAIAMFADWTDRVAGGRIAVRQARTAARHRAQRRGEPYGIGAARRPICTTRCRPTAAIRGSTPTARSTAPPRTARTSFRSSIP